MKLTLIATLVSAAALVQAADKCEKKYEVATDDSCESIALKLGFTKDNFEKWNLELDSSFDCDNLKVHDSICIKFPPSIEKRDENNQAQGNQSSDKTTGASTQGTQNSGNAKDQTQGTQNSGGTNDQAKDGQRSNKATDVKDQDGDENPKKKHKTTKKPLHGKKTHTKKHVPKKHVPEEDSKN